MYLKGLKKQYEAELEAAGQSVSIDTEEEWLTQPYSGEGQNCTHLCLMIITWQIVFIGYFI